MESWFTSGYAYKRGQVRKTWKRRFFSLDADGFQYFTENKKKRKGGCDLIDIESVSTVSVASRHPGWTLEVRWAGRTLLMQLCSIAERDRWRTAILLCIEKVSSNFTTSLSETTRGFSNYFIMHVIYSKFFLEQ